MFKSQPKAPENEHAIGEYSETRKKKRADKPATDVSLPASRQAPPKPPRTGKLSVEDAVIDTPMEQKVEDVAPKDTADAPLGRSNRLDGKREGSRKRDKEEGPSYTVSGSLEKSSTHGSSGKSDGSTVNEDTGTKKRKQSRKVAFV